ncbi:hypothetical protein A3Q56_08078, partial [Intoshia linei]
NPQRSYQKPTNKLADNKWCYSNKNNLNKRNVKKFSNLNIVDSQSNTICDNYLQRKCNGANCNLKHLIPSCSKCGKKGHIFEYCYEVKNSFNYGTSLFYIDCTIDKRNFKCLIDTGAVSSFLPSVFKANKPSYKKFTDVNEKLLNSYATIKPLTHQTSTIKTYNNGNMLIVTPNLLRDKLIDKLHCNSHSGIIQIVMKIKQDFYCTGLKKAVTDFIRKCFKYSLQNTAHNAQSNIPSYDGLCDELEVVDPSAASSKEWMNYLETKREECERRRAKQRGQPLHWYMNNGRYYKNDQSNFDEINQTPTNPNSRPSRQIKRPSYLKKDYIYDKYDSDN